MQICDGEEEMKNGATKKCENVKVQCGQGEGVILIIIIHVLLFYFSNFALLPSILALLHLPTLPIAILHFCIIALLKAKEQGHISP